MGEEGSHPPCTRSMQQLRASISLASIVDTTAQTLPESVQHMHHISGERSSSSLQLVCARAARLALQLAMVARRGVARVRGLLSTCRRRDRENAHRSHDQLPSNNLHRLLAFGIVWTSERGGDDDREGEWVDPGELLRIACGGAVRCGRMGELMRMEIRSVLVR